MEVASARYPRRRKLKQPGEIFARAVTGLGGTLEAVVPVLGTTPGSRHTRIPGTTHCSPRTAALRWLPSADSTPESHMAAGKLMLDQADELYAVRDGEPARAYGGTADVVFGLRPRARHPYSRAHVLPRRRSARLAGGDHTNRHGPQIYLRCTRDVPGPAAGVGDLRCRHHAHMATREVTWPPCGQVPSHLASLPECAGYRGWMRNRKPAHRLWSSRPAPVLSGAAYRCTRPARYRRTLVKRVDSG